MKASEAKKKQGYVRPGKGPICRNCKHYTSKIGQDQWGFQTEGHMKCLLGGFATKKTAWCKKYSPADKV